MDENVPKVNPEWPITAEQWKMVRDNRRSVLVSRSQASRWHLKVGDTFTVITPPIQKKTDGTNSWDLPGCGGDPRHQLHDVKAICSAIIDYMDKARWLSDQGKTGQFRVKLSDPSKTAEIAEEIDTQVRQLFHPATVDHRERRRSTFSNTGMDIASVDRDVALAGMFMVLFLTANGIAQAVRERLAEFATLKTIGFSDRGVIGLVFAEAAVPCLLGAALGVSMAFVLTRILPSLVPPGQGVPIPIMTPIVFVWAALCAAVVAFASSALPALRLKRMDIATALSGRV